MGKNSFKLRKKRKEKQQREGCKSSINDRWRGRAKRWQMLKQLTLPDWSQVNLEEVKKDLYQEHPNVKARDEAMIKEHMDQNRISVKGRDCPKPGQAFEEFSFSGGVMDAVKAQNFVKPTPIQSQAIPIALSGRDMVGIADTGSGKTLAFILPAITHILGNRHPRNVGEPEVVVLAPTRELAQQIHQVVVSLGPGIGVKSECFYGGAQRMEQATLTEKVFEICIATPGRMVDFLGEGWVKLHRCTFFVLDEADTMLGLGFEPQIRQVIEQARPDRQMLMFSATWPTEIQDLAEKYLTDYILVNVGSLEISANHNITQKLEFCEEVNKPQRIVQVMKQVMEEEENKTLIFVKTKVDVDVLTLKFRLNGFAAMGLHGGKKQTEREKVFSDFKAGNISILIATDLAARGLDVNDIKYIINYDYPFSSEDYVHRIGRTGRCDRKGTAITFFTPQDRGKAKDLICVLKEAGQDVPPHLQNMAQLPPLVKGGKRTRLPGLKLKKKHLKRILARKDINKVPLGSQTSANRLPELEDILDPIVIEHTQNTSGKKKKNKRKLQLVVNSEKMIHVLQQPGFAKRAKTDLHNDSQKDQPNKFTDDCDLDNFDNPQWAPCTSTQKYEERNIPQRNFSNSSHLPVTGSMNMQNSNVRTNGREMGCNSAVLFGNVPSSADVRRENTVYSTNNRYTWKRGNSRNYETSIDPRGREPSMNDRNMNMPMDPVNMKMPVNPGNIGMHTDPRNMHPPFSAETQLGASSDRRQNSMGWNGPPGRRSQTYNNRMGHQAPNWGPYGNNYNMNRMDTNNYPGHNWSGRSGYSQY